jgi:regulator of protease activity HflC (stomatin/prohibitin superfamily)
MAIKALVTFFVGAFIVALLAGLGLIAANSVRGRPIRLGVMLAIIGGAGAIILIPLNAGLVLVQPDEVGVRFRVTGSGEAALLEPLQPGLSWVVPFIDDVVIYQTSRQSITMADSAEAAIDQVITSNGVRAISSDGQAITVDLTVIYTVDATQINRIHRNWRDTYPDGFVVPQTRSEVRNAISEYGAEEIYSGGRAALEAQIVDALQGKLEQEGFILTDVLIRNISFSVEFTDAIERKQIAEQEAQRAVFLVQQAEQEAQQARVEAQGRADSAVIAAEGDAKAIIIKAEAESEALELINEVLAENPNLIQWQYINQLGDQVELIIIPSSTPFLFDLQELLAETGADVSVEPVPTPRPAPEGEGEGESTNQ